MLKALRGFVTSINRFNYRFGKFVGYLAGAIMFVSFYEIISRYVLNSPTTWSIEIQAYLLGAYFFLGGGYALLTDSFVRMDVFYSRWSVRKRAIVDACTFILVAVWLVVLIWKGFYWAGVSIAVGEHYVSLAKTPVGPIKTILVVGCVMLLLQAIALFIQDVYMAVRRRPLL